MLLLHTAEFGCDFINATYNRLAEQQGQPSVITSSRAALRTPLHLDPGERWEYGSNIDWAGQVIEGITGFQLRDVLKDRIFDELDMQDTVFTMSGPMRSRMATMHQRDNQRGLAALTDFILPQEPEVHMGGHGLYSTALDYAKFIRMWLNDGEGPGVECFRRRLS